MVDWSAMWGAALPHWPWVLIGAFLFAVLLVTVRYRKKLGLGHRLGAGIVLAVVVCVWVIYWIPAQQSTNFLEQNEARRTVVQICGGGFAIIAIVLAVIRIQQTTRDLAIKESGERTGRYLRSAELLGSVRQGEGGSPAPNIESRLGAIYSLGRLAIDSAEDYRAVVKLLASYVRIHAAPEPLLPGSVSGDDTETGKVRVDIQTAVEILAKPSAHRGVDRPRLDLRNTSLKELELEGADLFRANLSDAKLHLANLPASNLRGAALRYAKLHLAYLPASNLRGAVLRYAKFHGANLSHVCLQGADLEGAELPDADLSTAEFDPHTEFKGAELGTAKFYEKDGPTEEARGLSPDQILRAKEWEKARFSPSFHDKLMALAGAPTRGEESGASGTAQLAPG